MADIKAKRGVWECFKDLGNTAPFSALYTRATWNGGRVYPLK